MYRNALLCLVDAPPPARGRAAPAAQRAQGLGLRAHSGPSAWALPMGPPGLAPSPPGPARARRHRAVWHPPHPRARLLAALAVLNAVAGCGPPCATRGGAGGFTRSAAAGAQGRPARRRQPWPWGPRAPSPGSAALPPPPPSQLLRSRAGGPPGGPRHGSGPSISRPWRPGVQGTPTGRRASLNFAFSEQGREYAALSLNVEFSEIEGTKSPHPPTLCVLLSRASPG